MHTLSEFHDMNMSERTLRMRLRVWGFLRYRTLSNAVLSETAGTADAIMLVDNFIGK